jgi:hypothetical protein
MCARVCLSFACARERRVAAQAEGLYVIRSSERPSPCRPKQRSDPHVEEHGTTIRIWVLRPVVTASARGEGIVVKQRPKAEWVLRVIAMFWFGYIA